MEMNPGKCEVYMQFSHIYYILQCVSSISIKKAGEGCYYYYYHYMQS